MYTNSVKIAQKPQRNYWASFSNTFFNPPCLHKGTQGKMTEKSLMLNVVITSLLKKSMVFNRKGSIKQNRSPLSYFSDFETFLSER